jgi:hypothetical protein
VRVTSRHEPGTGWFARFWRVVAYRDISEIGPLRSPSVRSQHVALVSVLAERAHISIPVLLDLFDVGADYSVTVYALPGSRRLDELDDVTSADIEAVWRNVDALHGVGIDIGRLDATDVVVDSERRPWLVNLDYSTLAISAASHARDNAEVLVGHDWCCGIGAGRDAPAAAGSQRCHRPSPPPPPRRPCDVPGTGR